ncbi:L-seryl-tRNA(Sec) kinase [Eucyclogobius newberryi]|uniref:L-seryl-tRNA(Sec) kinase n=1 Tax=Eucyclogobius newberryi TaxID=166745 RepID=UPI003B5C41E3
MASARDSGVCLVVLCGLPAAGKSTLARELRGPAAELGWRSAAVNYDELIPEEAFVSRHEREEEPGEHTAWKRHRRAVLGCVEDFVCGTSGDGDKEAWQRRVRDVLGSNASSPEPAPAVLLLDDNFYYRSMRYEVHQLARKHSLGFCQLFLRCDLETCIRRNQKRAEPIPRAVMEEMERRLQPPDGRRNAWEENSVALDTAGALDAADIQKVLDLISFALKNPLRPVQDDTEQKEDDRVACAHSAVHRADQACRKLISDAVKSARDAGLPSVGVASLASELNQLKSNSLRDFKSRLLRDVSRSDTESAERDAATAVQVFDRQKEDVLFKTLENKR